MANREALPFTIILDDCSGNSFIQNHLAPLEDVQLLSEFYHRTKQMNIFLGLLADDEEEEEEGVEGKGNQPVSYSEPHLLSAEEAENFLRKLKPKVELRHDTEKPDAEEILTMPCHCTCCGLAGEIRMHIMGKPQKPFCVIQKKSFTDKRYLLFVWFRHPPLQGSDSYGLHLQSLWLPNQ